MALNSFMSKLVFLSVVLGLSCFSIYSVAAIITSRISVKLTLKFPTSVADIKTLVDELQSVKNDQMELVFLLFCMGYLFKQTFSIPGSFLLNLFAGAIFGSWIGVSSACVLSATGATLCFSMSKLLGQELIEHYFKDKVDFIRNKIKGRDEGASEFLLLISTRLFPATPNWLLNIALPHIGVNIVNFYFSVLIGLFPYNFLSVQTGTLLRYTSDIETVMDTKTFLILALSSGGLVALALFLRKKN